MKCHISKGNIRERNYFLWNNYQEKYSNQLSKKKCLFKKTGFRYDFNEQIIQVLKFKQENSCLKILTEIPFSKVGDMVNLRLIISPITLVKYDVQNDMAEFL